MPQLTLCSYAPSFPGPSFSTPDTMFHTYEILTLYSLRGESILHKTNQQQTRNKSSSPRLSIDRMTGCMQNFAYSKGQYINNSAQNVDKADQQHLIFIVLLIVSQNTIINCI